MSKEHEFNAEPTIQDKSLKESQATDIEGEWEPSIMLVSATTMHITNSQNQWNYGSIHEVLRHTTKQITHRYELSPKHILQSGLPATEELAKFHFCDMSKGCKS